MTCLFNKTSFFLIVTLLAMLPLVSAFAVKVADTIQLTPTENHHIIALNSNQPYVAGYHVDASDLYTRERVSATAIIVSFPSTNTDYFPSESWIGGGMFVQGQDNKLRHVDYAFYMMLVLDASGALFLDYGLHQTRESTAPLQMPTEELIYGYTWQVSGIAPATPVTLLARWDSEGSVHYSISASGINVTLPSINVAGLPNCANIIRQFYAGNAVTSPFPYGHYVYYFQFGIVSPRIIANNHWSVDIKDPKILRNLGNRLGTGWHLVDTTWCTQGDISYLDGDWMWGGLPYHGVSAQYYQNPLENPYEVIFFYNGQTLCPGTVLWQCTNSKLNSTALLSPLSSLTFGTEWTYTLSAEITIVIGIMSGNVILRNLRKKLMKTSRALQ